MKKVILCLLLMKLNVVANCGHCYWLRNELDVFLLFKIFLFFDYVFFLVSVLSPEMPILYSIANWEASLPIYRKTSFGIKKYILATYVKKITRHSRLWLKGVAEKKRDELLWLKMRRYQIFEIQPPHTPFRFKWPDSTLFVWVQLFFRLNGSISVTFVILFCYVSVFAWLQTCFSMEQNWNKTWVASRLG